MKAKCLLVIASILAACLASGPASAQQIQSMKLLTAQTGWAQSGNHLYWTTDGGTHWKDIAPHMSSKFGLEDVFFLDTNMGWALLSGTEENPEEAVFEIASTIDGGSDWHVAPIKNAKPAPGMSPVDGRGTIFFVDAAHGWMNLRVQSGGAFRLGILLMTEDGGKTWDWAPDGSDAGTGAIYFLTLMDGWIAGGPGDQYLYVTHDGANHWHEVALKPPPIITKGYTATYVVPIFQDRKHGFLPVTYTDGDDGQAVLVLFSSDDGGQTWKSDRVLPKRTYLSEGNIPTAVSDSVMLIAADSDNADTIQLTSFPPGGKASTTAAHISRGGAGASQLSFTASSRGWVSTSNDLFSTQDGGVSWTNITPGKVSGTGQPKRRSVHGAVAPKSQGAARVRPNAKSDANAIVDTQLGFESCEEPTLPHMKTWWEYSPYFDIGIYIGGDSRSCKNAGLTSKWVSKAEGYGWGIAPIWVGHQAPCACRRGKPGPTCKPFPNVFSWVPCCGIGTASDQGAEEADQAAAEMASLGLSTSVAYLDIESYTSSTSGSGQSCSAAVQAFLDGWVGEMHLNGFSTGAGVYGSSGNMQTDFSQVSPLPDEAWIAEYPTNTVAPSVSIWGLRHLCDIYSNPPCPNLWPTDQRIRQYLPTHDETWGKVKVNIDADIIDAPVAHPTTGSKMYTYNFDTFTPIGNCCNSAISINNIGATSSYGGFINGSASDFGGEVGETLMFEEWTAPGVGVTGWGYTILDWGTPLDIIPPAYTQSLGWCFSTARVYYCTLMSGINNAGWIVGNWNDYNDVTHGFLNQGGTLTSFDAPGAAAGTYATAINDAGLVVGYFYDSSWNSHGFLYNANTQQFIAAPIDYPGASFTMLNGINGDAQVVGEYFDGANFQGFLYANGTFTGTSGTCGPEMVPVGINNNDQIVGDGFVSYDGGLTCSAFSDPAGGAIPYSINDAGQIGGTAYYTAPNISFVAVPQTP